MTTVSARRRGALLTLLRPQRVGLGVAIGFGLLDQALALAAALLGAALVGRALNGAAAADLVPWLVVLIALVLPKVLAAWAESYIAHDLAFRVLAELRDRCYRKLAALTPGYLLRRRSGDVGATAMADVEVLELFFAHSLTPLVVAASVPPACLVAAFWVHPLVGLALLPAVVAMATVPFWLRRRSAVQAGVMRAAAGEATAETVDAVQGLTETLVFGRQDLQHARLRAAAGRLDVATRAHRSRGGLEKAAGDAIAAAGLVGVVLVALALVDAGALAADRVVVVAVVGGFAFLPLMTLVDTWRELSTIRAAASRLLRILEAEPDVVERPAAALAASPEPSVSFEGVRFRYTADGADALDGVSFTVEPGTTVALAGHSGAGKSTCASLLLRHWDVAEGVVRIGGHDVRDLPFERLRSLVVAVPQETYLFAMSVRENLRLARPDATDAEVEAAARTACAHEFVAAMPDGYDTLVGERGAHLSGGQRQRLAIARALLTRAPILVLDEAVSSLDSESEAAIDEALRSAKDDHTTLIVAHRPSTLRTADLVVLLHEGRVADIGPHDELLARSPAYRTLLAQPGLTTMSPESG